VYSLFWSNLTCSWSEAFSFPRKPPERSYRSGLASGLDTYIYRCILDLDTYIYVSSICRVCRSVGSSLWQQEYKSRETVDHGHITKFPPRSMRCACFPDGTELFRTVSKLNCEESGHFGAFRAHAAKRWNWPRHLSINQKYDIPMNHKFGPFNIHATELPCSIVSLMIDSRESLFAQNHFTCPDYREF
jgi:hypothetical protein